MRRAMAIGLLLLGLPAVAGAQDGSAAGLSVPRPGHRLVVTVVTRHDRGRVFCALWRGREGYPTEYVRSVDHALARTIRSHVAECVFADVPPGEYALAVFHDENSNNHLDRNLLGIPTEGTGASNDARGVLGPPPYDGARFQMPDALEHRLVVNLAYY